MNPIPLTDSLGLVRAYACGECHNAYGSGSIYSKHSFDTMVLVAKVAKAALCRAERCCRCTDCETPLPKHGRVTCNACEAAWKESLRWRSFAGAWRDIGEAAYREITSEYQWRAYQDALEELDR